MEEVVFQVTKLPGWNIIVGKSWLARHNPTIDWNSNMVSFTSGYCQAHCLPTRQEIPTPAPIHRIAMISRAAFQLAACEPESQLCIAAIYVDPDSQDKPA